MDGKEEVGILAKMHLKHVNLTLTIYLNDVSSENPSIASSIRKGFQPIPSLPSSMKTAIYIYD